MKVVLKEELSFIKKPGLLSFELEYRNGAWVIVSGSFTQTIKQSRFDQIMNIVNGSSAKEIESTVEVKSNEEKSNLQNKSKFSIGDKVTFSHKKQSGLKGEVLDVTEQNVKIKSGEKVFLVLSDKVSLSE